MQLEERLIKIFKEHSKLIGSVYESESADRLHNRLGEELSRYKRTARTLSYLSGRNRDHIAGRTYEGCIEKAIEEFEHIHAGVNWDVDETLIDGSEMPYGSDYTTAISVYYRHIVEGMIAKN